MGLTFGASCRLPIQRPTTRAPTSFATVAMMAPKQEGDTVPVREGGGGQQQPGEGSEESHPADHQQGGRRAGHRRAPLDPEQVPEQGEHGDEDHHQRQGGDALVVGADHEGDGADQAEQGRRAPTRPTQHGEGLAGGEGHDHEAEDRAR